MLSNMQAVVFALSILSVSLGRPFDSEIHHIKRVHKPAIVRAQVVRAQVVGAQVVPRDVSPSCTTCATVIVKVSGTATASAAFTVTVGSAPTSIPSPSIGSFGSCSVPQIEFGAGFDGRNETSFRPVDQVSYNHDSADDIGVITDFICSALVNTCGADSTAQATCATAQTAAAAETPQEGIDADAFNVVFGFQTNFKNVKALSNAGDPIAGSTTNSSSASASVSSIASETSSASAATDSISSSTAASNATVAPTPASSSSPNAATHDPSASHGAPPTTLVTVVQTTAQPTEPAPTSAAAGSSNASNLQTFTGALGGISAPAVVASGNGQFLVEGNSPFNTKTDGLSRSCDVQQNACANEANASGNKGSLTVAACHTQQDDCDAANGIQT